MSTSLTTKQELAPSQQLSTPIRAKEKRQLSRDLIGKHTLFLSLIFKTNQLAKRELQLKDAVSTVLFKLWTTVQLELQKVNDPDFGAHIDKMNSESYTKQALDQESKFTRNEEEKTALYVSLADNSQKKLEESTGNKHSNNSKPDQEVLRISAIIHEMKSRIKFFNDCINNTEEKMSPALDNLIASMNKCQESPTPENLKTHNETTTDCEKLQNEFDTEIISFKEYMETSVYVVKENINVFFKKYPHAKPSTETNRQVKTLIQNVLAYKKEKTKPTA